MKSRIKNRIAALAATTVALPAAALTVASPAFAGDNGQQIDFYVPSGSPYTNGYITINGTNQNGTPTAQTIPLGAGGTTTWNNNNWYENATTLTAHSGVGFIRQEYTARLTIWKSCKGSDWVRYNLPGSNGTGGGPSGPCINNR